MSLTQEEKTNIVNAVLSALRTNSKTIEQLDPVTYLNSSDSFEISGGKRITYSLLRNLISSALTTPTEVSDIFAQRIAALKGEPNGLAPLNANGKIAESYMLDSMFGVQDFGGFVEGVTAEDYIDNKGYKIPGCTVRYDSAVNRFVLQVEDGDTITYYRNWMNSGRHGYVSDGAVVPYTNKVYISPNGGGTAYLYGGSKLLLIAVDLINSPIIKRKADLDASGYVPAEQIPGDALDVVEFHGLTTVAAADIKHPTSAGSTTEGAWVFFNTTTRKFVLAVPKGDGSGGLDYYSQWKDVDRFGESHTDGATPYPHKTYFRLYDVSDNADGSKMERAYYRWNGTTLTLNFPHNPAIVPYAFGVSSDDPQYVVPGYTYDDSSAAEEDGRAIVYVANRKRFMLRVYVKSQNKFYLYRTFREQDEYGTPDDLGIVPHPFKIFRNEVGGEYQQWDGEKLTTPTSAYQVLNELSEVTGTLASGINDLRTTIDNLPPTAAEIDGIVDLGIVGDEEEAFSKAASDAIVDNTKVRMIFWRTRDDGSHTDPKGAGGVIFQERNSNYCVVQWMMHFGATRFCMARCITTGGRPDIGPWQNLILPTSLVFDQATGKIKAKGLVPSANAPAQTVMEILTLPTATSSAAGLMPAADKLKLDNLPTSLLLEYNLNLKVDKVTGKGLSTHDFNNEWITRLSNAGLYGRLSGLKYGVRNLYGLTSSSTDAEIKTALTSSDGKRLLETDLAYCADNGSWIKDETTGGYIMVNRATGDDGTMFNLIEISVPRIGAPGVTSFELPSMRLITLVSKADEALPATQWTPENKIWSCKRVLQEKFAYRSEIAALAENNTPIVNQTETSAVILPNTLNVWGVMESLDIELAEPTNNGIVNEYMIEFKSGATATELTLPESVKFPEEIYIEPNRTYQISIVNNIGLIVGVES